MSILPAEIEERNGQSNIFVNGNLIQSAVACFVFDTQNKKSAECFSNLAANCIEHVTATFVPVPIVNFHFRHLVGTWPCIVMFNYGIGISKFYGPFSCSNFACLQNETLIFKPTLHCIFKFPISPLRPTNSIDQISGYQNIIFEPKEKEEESNKRSRIEIDENGTNYGNKRNRQVG